MPSFPVLPESGGFFISKIFKLRAGLSMVKPFREFYSRNKIERPVHEKVIFGAGVGQLVSRLQIIGDFAG